MTMQPAGLHDGITGTEQTAVHPGPRLGWVFRDRRQLASPYPEPGPDPQAITGQLTARQEKAQQAWRFSRCGSPGRCCRSP